ncbi:hypothetical protein BVX97_06035 [bacterium E08(2017)]|nr:hypothetical protein BVX97_06035 [bacterium E08(2017)]
MFEISITTVLLRIIIGTTVGFTIGLTGIGGGVLILPALSLILGMPASTCVGTATLYAALTQLMSSYRHHKLKNINYPAALVVLAGGIPAAAATAMFLNRHAESLKDNAQALAKYESNRELFIGAVIAVAAMMLIADLFNKRRRRKVKPPAEFKKVTLDKAPGAIFTGASVGFLIASTSVGGGVITIPLLITLFKLPAARAVGSASLITLLLTATTSIVYGKGGMVDIATAIIMAAGSIAGVYIGSKLTLKIPDKMLQTIIIAIIIVAAAAMMIR